jgi:hypothetical protein
MRFTEADQDVVAQLVLYRRGITWLAQLLVQSYECDARDADLMEQLQHFRKEHGMRAWMYGHHPLPRLP